MANQSASVSIAGLGVATSTAKLRAVGATTIVGLGVVTATSKERESDSTTIIGVGVCQVSLPTTIKAKPKAVSTATATTAPPLKTLTPPTFPPHYSVRRTN